VRSSKSPVTRRRLRGRRIRTRSNLGIRLRRRAATTHPAAAIRPEANRPAIARQAGQNRTVAAALVLIAVEAPVLLIVVHPLRTRQAIEAVIATQSPLALSVNHSEQRCAPSRG